MNGVCHTRTSASPDRKPSFLIAPRPHLSLAGIYDSLTPPQGLDKIDEELKRVYKNLGASEAWQVIKYPQGHFENPSMRVEIVKFVKKWL